MDPIEFTDLFNKFIEAYPPRREESKDFFHEQLWEELKFSKPIIKQVFRKISQTWDKSFFPPIAEFVKIRNEIKRYGAVHYPENEDCTCLNCRTHKNMAKGMCYKCGKALGYPYECIACHLNGKIAFLNGDYSGLWKCSCLICQTLELTDLDLSNHDKNSLKEYVMMKKANLNELKSLMQRRADAHEFGDSTILSENIFDEINKAGKKFDPESMKF